MHIMWLLLFSPVTYFQWQNIQQNWLKWVDEHDLNILYSWGCDAVDDATHLLSGKHQRIISQSNVIVDDFISNDMHRLRTTFTRSRTPTGAEMKTQSSLEVPKQVRKQKSIRIVIRCSLWNKTLFFHFGVFLFSRTIFPERPEMLPWFSTCLVVVF